MSKSTIVNRRTCIYCGGQATGVRKGEHIVPAVIGGALTIKEISGRLVCHSCNNGVLSQVDRELCNRSWLSVVASQELGSHLWQAWDVDASSRNLLLEARPDWKDGELNALICYPQLTFERSGPHLRGDVKEVTRFGREGFEKLMVAAIRRAFQRYNAGERKALHLERIHTDVKSRRYRYPPRVYTTHSLCEIARDVYNQSFILRFSSQEDLRFALTSLSRFDAAQPFKEWSQNIGAHLPAFSHFFDMGLTVRALMKIGINLLAAYCQKTRVSDETFGNVIHVIRGDADVHQSDLSANGFTRLAKPQNEMMDVRSHYFKIVYLDRHWIVYSGFFGGRINTVVTLLGPNDEAWNTLEIVAPLKNKKWQTQFSSIIQPVKVQVEWNDISKIVPSLKLQHSHSQVVVEERPRRKKGKPLP